MMPEPLKIRVGKSVIPILKGLNEDFQVIGKLGLVLFK